MMDKERLAFLEHPMVFGSFKTWVQMLRHSPSVEARFFPRVAIVFLSTLAVLPLRWIEGRVYRNKVEATEIHPEPVFIIGHWRSGTTHLHNIMVQDHNLGFVGHYQGLAPGSCMVGEPLIRPILAWISKRIHPTRLIDNIPLSFDAPQEDEFAIANSSPYSFLHLFTFPQQAQEYFERYVLLQNLPEGILEQRKALYLFTLQKATMIAGGKRLALKNPSHSGRLPELLELFPRARFIHIYRNPYNIFQSMRVLFHKVMPRSQVHSIPPEMVDEYILSFYEQKMRKFLADKHLIPEGSLVEVRFEDLETAPLAQLERIYAGLGLDGYAQALPAFKSYLETIADYQKNQYTIDNEVIEKVNRHWGFALEAWGYDRLPTD